MTGVSRPATLYRPPPCGKAACMKKVRFRTYGIRITSCAGISLHGITRSSVLT